MVGDCRDKGEYVHLNQEGNVPKIRRFLMERVAQSRQPPDMVEWTGSRVGQRATELITALANGA